MWSTPKTILFFINFGDIIHPCWMYTNHLPHCVYKGLQYDEMKRNSALSCCFLLLGVHQTRSWGCDVWIQSIDTCVQKHTVHVCGCCSASGTVQIQHSMEWKKDTGVQPMSKCPGLQPRCGLSLLPSKPVTTTEIKGSGACKKLT